MRLVLPGYRYLRFREMRPPGLLPLLHQDESALRPEVLRCLPGGAGQGARRCATLTRGLRPRRYRSFLCFWGR